MANTQDSENPSLPSRGTSVGSESATPTDGGSIPIQSVPPELIDSAVTHSPPPRPEEPLTPERLAAEIGRLDAALVLLVLVFAFLMASFTARSSDFNSRNSDLWMHLATGRLIAQGEFHFGKDPFAFTTANETWVNHSWLADLVAFELSRLFGGPEQAAGGGILVAVKALLVLLAAAFMISIRRREKGFWIPAGLVALALFAMSPWVLVQPTCISVLFLGVTIWILFRPGEALGPIPQMVGEPNRLPERSSFRGFFVLLPLFALWVNLDEWFILGPITVALYLIGRWAQNLTPGSAERPEVKTSAAELKALGLTLVGGTLACLANPYLLGAFTLPTEIWTIFNGNEAQADPWFLAQFRGGLSRENVGSVDWWAFVGLLGAGVTSFALGLSEIRYSRAILWVAFALLAISRAKTIPLFAVVGAPIAALNFQELAIRLHGAMPRVDHPWRIVALAGRIASVVVGVALLFAAWPGWLNGRRVAWNVEVEPSLKRLGGRLMDFRATGILTEDSRGMNINPGVADYCAWFCPAEKGFVDSRLTLFGGVLRDYEDVRSGLRKINPEDSEPVPFEKILRDHRIDHLIFNVTRPGNTPSLLKLFWDLPNQWVMLYGDGRSTVFGWVDPKEPAKGDRFVKHRYQPGASAFAPELSPDVLAPEESATMPEAAGFLSQYLNGPPPPPSLPTDESFFVQAAYFDRLNRELNHFKRMSGIAESSRFFCVFATPIGAQPGGLLVFEGSFLDWWLNPASISPKPVSPAPLFWALRAARIGIGINPEDSDAYQRLGLAYQRIFSMEQGWSGGKHSLLVEVRQAQIANALETALRLNPANRQLYIELADFYRQINYYDLAIDHLNELRDLLRSRGPEKIRTQEGVTEEPPDKFEERLKVVEQRITKTEQDLRLQDRLDQYRLNGSGKPLLQKVQLALQLGLPREALALVRSADPNEIAGAGDLIAGVLIGTGQAEDVRRNEFQLSAWPRIKLAAVLGDYKQAEDGEYGLEALRRAHHLSTAQRLIGTTRALTFGGIRPIQGLQQMGNTMLSLYEEIDSQILHGVMCLEEGKNKIATADFQRGIELSKTTKPQGDSKNQTFFQPGTLPIAEQYLKLLKAAGN